MANSFVKSSILAGTAGTAALFNHAETQADCIETDLAAGSLPIAVSALTGTIAAARLPSKYATIFLSAAGGKPRTSNGCAPPAWTELTTNKIMVPSLDFDKDADEYAQWLFVMPDGYTGGDIKVRALWTAASGTAGNSVAWMYHARTFADDDALDQALSADEGTLDYFIAANDLHVSAEAATITPTGTPAGGELMVFEVMRDVSGDNLAADARLIGVRIEYPTTYGD